jgi:hypothetical protein
MVKDEIEKNYKKNVKKHELTKLTYKTHNSWLRLREWDNLIKNKLK